MSIPSDLLSISGFARDYRRVYRQLRQSGQPRVLSIHGRAAMVVQDAAAYERLLDLLESAYLDQAVQAAIDDPRPTLSAAEVKRRWRQKQTARASRP